MKPLAERIILTTCTERWFVAGSNEVNKLYQYWESLAGRPIYTHEYPEAADELKARAMPDLLELAMADAPLTQIPSMAKKERVSNAV